MQALMGYVQARRERGQWHLYYIGTLNEVFPGSVFTSASDARKAYAEACAEDDFRIKNEN